MCKNRVSFFPTDIRETGPAGDPKQNKIYPWIARDNEKQLPILDPAKNGIEIPTNIRRLSIIGKVMGRLSQLFM